MERSSIEEDLKEYFAERDDVAAVYLFGSVARGEPGPADIDVAVLFKEEPPRTLDGLGLDIASDLEGRFHTEIDIIVLNSAPVDLVHRILVDGRLVVDQAPSLRIRFEVRARNEYFDLLPYLKEYRRAAPDSKR